MLATLEKIQATAKDDETRVVLTLDCELTPARVGQLARFLGRSDIEVEIRSQQMGFEDLEDRVDGAKAAGELESVEISHAGRTVRLGK
jgi:hypothetical protein